MYACDGERTVATELVSVSKGRPVLRCYSAPVSTGGGIGGSLRLFIATLVASIVSRTAVSGGHNSNRIVLSGLYDLEVDYSMQRSVSCGCHTLYTRTRQYHDQYNNDENG